jgi:ubiquitin-protein ligase
LLSDANLDDPLDEEVAELFKTDPEGAAEKGMYD